MEPARISDFSVAVRKDEREDSDFYTKYPPRNQDTDNPGSEHPDNPDSVYSDSVSESSPWENGSPVSSNELSPFSKNSSTSVLLIHSNDELNEEKPLPISNLGEDDNSAEMLDAAREKKAEVIPSLSPLDKLFLNLQKYNSTKALKEKAESTQAPLTKEVLKKFSSKEALLKDFENNLHEVSNESTLDSLLQLNKRMSDVQNAKSEEKTFDFVRKDTGFFRLFHDRSNTRTFQNMRHALKLEILNKINFRDLIKDEAALQRMREIFHENTARIFKKDVPETEKEFNKRVEEAIRLSSTETPPSTPSINTRHY